MKICQVFTSYTSGFDTSTRLIWRRGKNKKSRKTAVKCIKVKKKKLVQSLQKYYFSKLNVQILRTNL